MRFQGKVCAKDPSHGTERHTSGHCVQCQKLRLSAYFKGAGRAKAAARSLKSSKKKYAESAEFRESMKCRVNSRRSDLRKFNYGELDDLIKIEAYRLARLRSRVFGFPWHVDHEIPLFGETVCGFHVGINLRVIPAVINLAKGNNHV